MYTQLKTPDIGIAYTGGLCLEAVRDAFGIGKKYGTAMEDWKSGQQKAGRPPVGYAVPVYFSLSNEPAGHIAIALPDGRVASSTKEGTHQGLYIHPTIGDLMKIYSTKNNGVCSYLGWSNEVNDTPVISGGSTMFSDELAVRRAVEGTRLEFLPHQPLDESIVDADVTDIIARQGYGLFFKNIHAAVMETEASAQDKLNRIKIIME